MELFENLPLARFGTFTCELTINIWYMLHLLNYYVIPLSCIRVSVILDSHVGLSAITKSVSQSKYVDNHYLLFFRKHTATTVPFWRINHIRSCGLPSYILPCKIEKAIVIDSSVVLWFLCAPLPFSFVIALSTCLVGTTTVQQPCRSGSAVEMSIKTQQYLNVLISKQHFTNEDYFY